MAEDWGQLADDYEDDDSILIGKMNCKSKKNPANQQLCEDLGVNGYPTLLFGNVVELKSYKGARTIEEFRDHVQDYLVGQSFCGVTTPELCHTVLRRQRIEQLQQLGFTRLDRDIRALEMKRKRVEQQKQEFVKSLQKQYSQALKKKNKAKAMFEKESSLELMKTILQLKEKQKKNK